MASIPPPDAAWRDSSRPAKFWVFEAYTIFPILLALYNIQIWTISLALATVCFLSILSYYGFTLRVFGRLIRNLISGPRKSAISWWA
ncbi:MAG: IcmT/TraK family protein [Pseudomonadota bacterium]|nr:IcmT/TraK family protein [Pseudomonadota bacterium]